MSHASTLSPGVLASLAARDASWSMLLNGRWASRPDVLEVRDPGTGRVVGTVPKATREDMSAAIAAAVEGARRMKELPTHQRILLLRRAAEHVEARHEAFARTIALEGIKTIREARKEVTRAVETLRIASEEARRVSGETLAFDQRPGSEHRVGYYVREPLGIIGAITPFNDPLNLVAHKVGPALAAGNAVILKPHTETPLSALMLAEALVDAGVPQGALQVITGLGSEVGETLVTDPRVRMISFTGGLETGLRILRQAGLKKVGMELGSNCPTLVMADADLDRAIPDILSGAFWAAGQNCLHVQRLLVEEGVYEEVKDQLKAGAEAYVVGDKLDEATDMGPLIHETAARKVEKLVAEALAQGATLITGGTRAGTFYAPTLIEDLPPTCALAREEVYGPVTVLYRFRTLDEAIAMANDADYGLQAAIFTRDINTAHKAIAGLACGGVIVNDTTDYRIDAMPFGGVKGSGLGREGLKHAIQDMTEPKVVCFNL